jgi:CHAD domain-containing protein
MMQVEGTTPLWIAARVLLYERGDDFFRRRDKVLETFDAEDIHDLRVSSRRLREGLELFAPCYPPENLTRLIRKVRRVTRLMGEIRNADEAILYFSALTDELDGPCRPDLEKLVKTFQKNRGKGLKRLRLGLREMVPGSWRDRFRRGISSPSLFNPPAGGVDLFAPLADFARGALDARFADVMKLLPDACLPGEIEAQHLLRIAVKHFRYRMELLGTLVGPRFADLHAVVKGYQDVLGNMHDLDLFAGIVRGEKFPPMTEQRVLDAITSKRAGLYSEFIRKLEVTPIQAVGREVRSGL